MPKKNNVLTKQLLDWHKTIDRPMPWKETEDPYSIWISEIILQQTRVAQGMKYYENILNTFPTVQDLAAADEDAVMSVWKGLGYYSRARNLHAAAQTIVNEYNGEFPRSYSDILSLKGIGPYTAAAIASFAFGLPHAVVDGNVYRVLSRYFGVQDPIDESTGRERLQSLAQECLDLEDPGKYNQAIMDFGALQCTPQSPDCSRCPLVSTCAAYREGLVDILPIKIKKIKVKPRYFKYFVITKDHKTLLNKRTRGDVWQGLYEPPLIESKAVISKKALALQASIYLGRDISASKLNKAITMTQKLTHQTIEVTFYNLDIELEKEGYLWFSMDELEELAMPRIVDKYFQEINTSGLQGSLF